MPKGGIWLGLRSKQVLSRNYETFKVEIYNSDHYYRQTSLGLYSGLYAYPHHHPCTPCGRSTGAFFSDLLEPSPSLFPQLHAIVIHVLADALATRLHFITVFIIVLVLFTLCRTSSLLILSTQPIFSHHSPNPHFNFDSHYQCKC